MAVSEIASGNAVSDGHPDMDYAEHEKTYALFTFLFKWGTVLSAAAIVLLALITL